MLRMIQRLRSELEAHRDCVLVTLLHTEGSTPRGVGAQMAVGAAGRLFGSIGGGAVELESTAYAELLLARQSSAVRGFALHPNSGEDIGMLCGGTVQVHFQFISAQSDPWRQLLTCAEQRLAQHRTAVLFLRMDGGMAALCADGLLLAGELPPDAAPLCPMGVQLTEQYAALPLSVGYRAVIFGAGHVAQSLCPLLRSVDFRPVVFDDRPALAVPALFPTAEEVICGDFGSIAVSLRLMPDDFVAVMTDGHAHDLTVEEQVLRGGTAYLGVIGSHRKAELLHEKLLACGFSPEQLSAVHSPIGTEIRAVTPAEIAVSIAGEMISERALLRQREGLAEKHSCPSH